MNRDEMCVCGHPQSLHKIYACTGSRSNPTPKKPTAFGASAEHFKRKKFLTPPNHG